MLPEVSDVLFIDIETVPQFPEYGEVPLHIRSEWEKKCAVMQRIQAAEPAVFYEKAGIYAEFGKIICISAVWMEKEELTHCNFFGHDEEALLREFGSLTEQFFKRGNKRLCAHNGKEFDFPYIGRRMLVNGIRLPDPFRIAGKKPWEIPHLDTMELWKFGDYKNYTSLSLLASVFGLPSPKNDIDGSMVGRIYWESGDLERIARYCCQDANTVAHLYMKLLAADPAGYNW